MKYEITNQLKFETFTRLQFDQIFIKFLHVVEEVVLSPCELKENSKIEKDRNKAIIDSSN